MKYLVINLIVSLTLSYAYGQEANPEATKQVQLMKKVLYENAASVFGKERMFFKTNVSTTLPWQDFTQYDQATLKKVVDSLAHHGKLKVETGTYSGNRLVFESRFPLNMKGVDKIFRLKIVDHSLKDSVGQRIIVSTEPSIFYGSGFSSGYANGQSYSIDWETIISKFAIQSKISGANLQGHATFRGEFVSRYEFVKISRKDIGKEFVFNGKNLKVIDVIENKLVLSGANDIDFKFMNLDDNGYEIVPLTLVEMNELKKKDQTISVMSSGSSQSKTYQKVYELFSVNPEISFEEFSAQMDGPLTVLIKAQDKEAAKVQQFGSQYITIKTAGPIKNLFLYSPIFGFQSDFTIRQ